MDKDRLLKILENADELTLKHNYTRAFSEYEKAFPLMSAELYKDRRSKSIGNMAGWTAAFLTGGIGLEDLFIVPAVSKGVSGLLGVDDSFANQMIASLVLRQIDCLLHDDGLIRSIPVENMMQKFAMLYSASGEHTTMEKVLGYYMPYMQKATPFDDPEVLQSSLTYVAYAIDNHPTEWNEYHFLLYSYLNKAGDRSEIYQRLCEMFNEDFSSEERQQTEAPPPTDEQPKTESYYYSVLGVSHGASKEEIRKAYLELLKKYHPDRFAALSEEFQELANKRTKQIIEAYEFLNNKYN
jgi:DnaJ-domain-containing protein 1